MRIRNGDSFSIETNNFLEKYYSYILNQEKEYYDTLSLELPKLEKEISRLETKIYYAEQTAEWLEKHEDGSFFDMFIGCYAPDLREYVEAKEDELTILYNVWEQKNKFYELYTNLLNNGILINDSVDGCYLVEPYDNKLYSVIRKK